MDNQITLNVSEFFSIEELKEIAEKELLAAFRAQFCKESDVERVCCKCRWLRSSINDYQRLHGIHCMEVDEGKRNRMLQRR